MLVQLASDQIDVNPKRIKQIHARCWNLQLDHLGFNSIDQMRELLVLVRGQTFTCLRFDLD